MGFIVMVLSAISGVYLIIWSVMSRTKQKTKGLNLVSMLIGVAFVFFCGLVRITKIESV